MIKGKGIILQTGFRLRNQLRRPINFDCNDASIVAMTCNYYFGNDVLKRWDGNQWQIARLERYNGSEWVDSVLKRWNGTEWVNVTTNKN